MAIPTTTPNANPFPGRRFVPGHVPDHGPVDDDPHPRHRTHGGSRNAGKRMKCNTSGLAGISFRNRTDAGRVPGENIYVIAIWTDASNVRRSNAYNIRRHGPLQAMTMAVAARSAAGLPPVGLSTAMAALKRYLDSIGHPMADESIELRMHMHELAPA